MSIYTITQHKLLLQLFWWTHAIYGTLIPELRLPSLSHKQILLIFLYQGVHICPTNWLF